MGSRTTENSPRGFATSSLRENQGDSDRCGVLRDLKAGEAGSRPRGHSRGRRKTYEGLNEADLVEAFPCKKI